MTLTKMTLALAGVVLVTVALLSSPAVQAQADLPGAGHGDEYFAAWNWWDDGGLLFRKKYHSGSPAEDGPTGWTKVGAFCVNGLNHNNNYQPAWVPNGEHYEPEGDEECSIVVARSSDSRRAAG